MRSETEIQSLRELLNHERNLAVANIAPHRKRMLSRSPSDELDSAEMNRRQRDQCLERLGTYEQNRDIIF
jgi:hypothetical protein